MRMAESDSPPPPVAGAKSPARPALDDLFEGLVAFDPAGDFEAFLRAVPAKWVAAMVKELRRVSP